MKPRVYIDTSVIGGCLDEEFARWSKALIDRLEAGSVRAVISDLTRSEIDLAPGNVQKILSSIPTDAIENVFLNEEAINLSREYLLEDIIPLKHIIDAQHIAIATVEQVDLLVSWNFQHIVNIQRIRGFNAVNLKNGYHMLEIRSPREVVYEQEY
ncbi:MAG: PIN domain protein [Betaproteobacteria bacterium]|nr:PIN domain protein [Betaproteobacteria bacterium]